jgi:hypothetical protein
MKRTKLFIPILGVLALCALSSCTAVVEAPAPATTSTTTTVERETVRTPATTTTTRSTGY